MVLLLVALLEKIERTYYKHAAQFCQKRANNAFNEHNVSYVKWERLASEYWNKYVVARETALS